MRIESTAIHPESMLMSNLYHRLNFVVILTSLFFAALTVIQASAASSIVYNALYDCGPNRNKFKIIDCNVDTCNVFYLNAAMPGGGYTSHVARSILEQAGVYGCFVKGGGTPGKPAAANPTNGAAATAKPFALAPTAKPLGSGSVVAGKYECYTYSGGHLYSAMSENFTIVGAAAYTDAAGTRGTFTLAGNVLTFQGGALNGHRAQYTPGVPGSNNPPHIALLMTDGNPGDTCDGKG